MTTIKTLTRVLQRGGQTDELVVDDEPNLLVAVGTCLRGEGFAVMTARSGAEALVRVAESVPDLVVSDVRMPGMDGYQLARQLRASPRTALTPVVFLTAKDTCWRKGN